MATKFMSKYFRGVTSFSGQLVRGTTPADLTSFKIPDSTIINLVSKSFGGRRPDNVFYKDPSPWGNIFAQYSWVPLTTTLRPINFTLVGKTQKSAVVASDQFTNNSPTKSSWNVSLNKEVSNTSSSTWSNQNSFGTDVSATAGVNLQIVDMNMTIDTNFTHTWGQSQTTQETTTIGTTSGFSVDVDPGQTRKAILKAILGTYNLRIDYEAKLSGGVFANYTEPVNGHHYWYLNIDQILQSGYIANSVKITQNIETNKFFNGQIIVN